MSSNQKIKLQALRIPPGWTIDWNTFYEVDPEEGKEAFFEGSSLLQMSNAQLKKIIDLEWRPESDLNGCYQLRVINFIENYNPRTHQYDRDTDWEAPHLTFSTRSRLKLVQKLEELFISLPPTLDERIRSKRG
ncbi:MAG TPA: hypothetical protein VJ953_06745 [Saprospiraceae bacterium]|nr:hypothetical protein [Saprospiraceae bacterium]